MGTVSTLATTPPIGQVIPPQQAEALSAIKSQAADNIAKLNKKNATFSKRKPIDCKDVCKLLHDQNAKRPYSEKDKVDVDAEGHLLAAGTGDKSTFEGETTGTVQDGSYQNPDGSTTYYQNAIVPSDTSLTSETEQSTSLGPDLGVAKGTTSYTSTQKFGLSFPWTGPPPGAP